MALTLGPIFTEPLHRQPWCNYGRDRGDRPECPQNDYRITNPFLGVDLVNGGRHGAVDVGNAAQGFPVLMPAGVWMRLLHHVDGARGREIDLGNGYSLRLWHLAASSLDPQKPLKGTAHGPWSTKLPRGYQIGRTGSTGISIGAHTHIELWHFSDRLDPEPHLFIDGKPGQPIEGAPDDMASFTDVPEDHPFYADIEWLAAEGIAAGIPNGDGTLRFEPERPVKRSELAAFLRRHDQDADAH